MRHAEHSAASWQISILAGRQITFIVECGTIFPHKCFLCRFFYLSGSDRAILVYFIVNILRFAGQFKISQIGSHIQVIQVIEYLFAFIAVLYFFQLVLVHTFFRQCLQFLPYGCFGSFQRDAWGGFAGDMEQSLVNAARDIGVDAVEYLFLLHQMLHQAAGTSAT